MFVHPKDGSLYPALNSPFRWVGGKVSRLGLSEVWFYAAVGS